MVRKKDTVVKNVDDSPLTKLLTAPEVAELLRCTVPLLAKWRAFGTGPKFVRIGGRIRYRPSDVQKYVAEQTVESTSAA